MHGIDVTQDIHAIAKINRQIIFETKTWPMLKKIIIISIIALIVGIIIYKVYQKRKVQS